MYGITIAADSGSVVTSALQLFSQFAIIGGGLWAVWGVVTPAGWVLRKAMASPSGVDRIQASVGCGAGPRLSGWVRRKSLTCSAPAHSCGSMRPSISTAAAGITSPNNTSPSIPRIRHSLSQRAGYGAGPPDAPPVSHGNLLLESGITGSVVTGKEQAPDPGEHSHL